jgi:hypothetical protein
MEPDAAVTRNVPENKMCYKLYSCKIIANGKLPACMPGISSCSAERMELVLRAHPAAESRVREGASSPVLRGLDAIA